MTRCTKPFRFLSGFRSHDHGRFMEFSSTTPIAAVSISGKEIRSDYFSFGAVGGELNYYFFYGPGAENDCEELCGSDRAHAAASALDARISAKPLQLLPGSTGTRNCRRPIARRKLPLDAIYFDIDYQQNNKPFTVNREYFPNFEKMIGDFRGQGVHTVLITDLHIARRGWRRIPLTPSGYEIGMKNGVFVKSADGNVFVGTVWPGDSVFPDFTLAKARDYWGGLYKDFVGMGVSGFWNDMNEPSVFLRDDKTMPLTNAASPG